MHFKSDAMFNETLNPVTLTEQRNNCAHLADRTVCEVHVVLDGGGRLARLEELLRLRRTRNDGIRRGAAFQVRAGADTHADGRG